MTKALFLLAILTLSLRAEARLGGDWSSHGGGGGVACFADETDAVKAEAFLSAAEPLPDDLLARAQLQSLEHWEMDQSQLPLLHLKDGATRDEILAEAMSRLRFVSPIFAKRMEQAADWMEFSSWSGQDSLARLGDAKPTAPLTSRCRLVQLALRHSNGNNARGEGPVKGAIQLNVEFDRRLFARLAPVDQAMLILHEQLYAMGQAVGQDSSDYIRNFVRVLFSVRPDEWKQESEGGVRLVEGTAFLKHHLIAYFGDYLLFFLKLDGFGAPAPQTGLHHFLTFLKLLDRARPANDACVEAGRGPEVCRAEFTRFFLERTTLTDEEAFLFVAFYLLDRTEMKINGDYLMNPWDDRRLPLAMSHACSLLAVDGQRLKKQTAVTKGLRYCADYFPSSQGNKSN